MTDSAFLRHDRCPDCGSSDGNAVYTDGHTHCFVCGAHSSGDVAPSSSPRRPRIPALDKLEHTEVRGLRTRKITDDTCGHFGYVCGEIDGEAVQAAPYYNADRQLVAYKVRYQDKRFKVLGDFKDALPFGSHCWPTTGRMIVVTEGEVDALSMSQVQGNKYPVVSIGCGAGGQVKKYIAQHREYFSGFEKVVLMFDMDEPGRSAAKLAAEVLGARAHIASLPLKDANEMLVAGRADELIKAMWGAEAYRPDGLVDLASLKDAAKERPREGLSWPWPAITKMTYGIHRGHLIALGAGTGVGKSDFFSEVQAHLVKTHNEKIGVFALEQVPTDTTVRFVGKLSRLPLHVPDAWDPEAFDKAWSETVRDGRVFLYDSFGRNEWDAIEDKIEYLHHSEGVNYFFLDHITALTAGEDDERKVLDSIMERMSSLVTKLNITLFFISHLATPEGKPHEEGGRVYLRHFRGSRAIGIWAHFAFGLERNQQDEDVTERCTTTVRCLKDRLTGRAVGETARMIYDRETGMLNEATVAADGSPFGFQAVTEGKPSDF